MFASLSRLIPRASPPCGVSSRLTISASSFPIRQSTRTMSTSQPVHSQWSDGVPSPFYTYLVVMPDLPDSKRASLRDQHLQMNSVGNKNGRVIDGAAYFNRDPATLGREPTVEDMGGSFQIIRARNAEEVREKLSQDIYNTGGAWDLSKLQIFPIINKPLPS